MLAAVLIAAAGSVLAQHRTVQIVHHAHELRRALRGRGPRPRPHLHREPMLLELRNGWRRREFPLMISQTNRRDLPRSRMFRGRRMLLDAQAKLREP